MAERKLPPEYRMNPALAGELCGDMMDLQARVQGALAAVQVGDPTRTPRELALLLQLSDAMDRVVDYYMEKL